MSEIQLIQQAEQLFSAAREGDVELVEELVEKGANVNVKDADDGHAPLHFAAYNGRTDIVKALKGADVNIKNNNGHAPLHWAINDGHTKVVLALLAEGADVNVKDADGRTPLHLAAQDGYTETVECLINHIAKLVAAGLYVSQENLECTSDFISSTQERRNDYSQHLQQYKEEIVKLIKENKPLHDFLKESNINKLVSIWEKNEDIHSQFDDQKSLKEQYPEYAHILINKANEVKKEIFLYNYLPLIVTLSKHYKPNDLDYITLFYNMRNDLDYITFDYIRDNPDYGTFFDNIKNDLDYITFFDNMRSNPDYITFFDYIRGNPDYVTFFDNMTNDLDYITFFDNIRDNPDYIRFFDNMTNNLDNMTFAGMKNFFETHREAFKEKLGSGGITLMNFIDFEDVTIRHYPIMKVQAFAKVVNTVLDNPNLEQIQGQAASRS